MVAQKYKPRSRDGRNDMTGTFLHSIDFAVWKDHDGNNPSRAATVEEIAAHVRIKSEEEGRAYVEVDEGYTIAPGNWRPYR